MKKKDVIIIGAGAAGLMAAYLLVKAGRTITILEARNRTGGRIHTINNEGFSAHAELGAEFVHGNLPVTLNLLREAGINTTSVDFEMWHNHDGKFTQSGEFVEGWDNFLEKLNGLKQDMPLQEFVNQNFAGDEYVKMRAQIENYVSGYDTADVVDASAFALRNEWNHEDEDAQHRVSGGYIKMIEFLEKACRNAGNDILLNTVAHTVKWEQDTVKVITTNSTFYEAEKLIIALPLGVLQASKEAEGAVVFNPPLPQHDNAINNIGFGSIIKILLEFDSVFWKSDTIKANLSTMGFLFAYEEIPTYWTQAPAHSALLTGWLGGPPAYDKKDLQPEDILQLTLTSLSNIFKFDVKTLKNKLVAWKVANWTTQTYTRGSYAYDKVKSPEARKVLQHPVKNTIYFAGEYLYNGPAMGTVEAALNSGKNVAEMILKG